MSTGFTPTVKKFYLKKYNHNPTISGQRYPALVDIPLYDEVLDPETGQPRVIKVATGEQSIWMDEHVDKTRPKETFQFINGFGFVDVRQKTLSDFMSMTNFNKDTPEQFRMPGKETVFFEFKPVEMAEKGLEEQKDRAEAMSRVFDMTDRQLQEVTAALGENEEADIKLQRYHLTQYAEAEPEKFTKLLNSGTVAIRANVNEAVKKGVVAHDMANKRLKWPAGQLIYEARENDPDAIEGFVNLATTEDGAVTYGAILTLLGKNNTTDTAGVEKAKEDALSHKDVWHKSRSLKIVKYELGEGFFFNGDLVGGTKDKYLKRLQEDNALFVEIRKAVLNAE